MPNAATTLEEDALNAVASWTPPRGIFVEVEDVEIRPGPHVADDVVVSLIASHGGVRVLMIAVSHWPEVIKSRLDDASIALHNSTPETIRRGHYANAQPIRRRRTKAV